MQRYVLAKTITATDAARNFRQVLNEIADTGETFRIERHGQMVAQLGPPGPSTRHFTGGDLTELLQRLPPPDADFAADLAQVRANWRAAATRDPWQVRGSSSTAQS